MEDPLRSMQYYVDLAHAHEYLSRCCLESLMRSSPRIDNYAFERWHHHLSLAYPSSELRILLALFTEKDLRCLVVFTEECGASSYLVGSLYSARQTCLSFKWIKSLSDIKVAWRIAKASRKVDEAHLKQQYRQVRPLRAFLQDTLHEPLHTFQVPVMGPAQPTHSPAVRLLAHLVLFLCCAFPIANDSRAVGGQLERVTTEGRVGIRDA
ncbi:hypothetical protein BDR07DRAFT_1607838 [Suillus spraguei]|nr:hypothetical protein BDR07DRAFT_1607838 [Suillus spraguei]